MYEEFEKLENAHDTHTSSVLPQSIRKRCQANCKSVSPSRVKRNNIRYQCIKQKLAPQLAWDLFPRWTEISSTSNDPETYNSEHMGTMSPIYV